MGSVDMPRCPAGRELAGFRPSSAAISTEPAMARWTLRVHLRRVRQESRPLVQALNVARLTRVVASARRLT